MWHRLLLKVIGDTTSEIVMRDCYFYVFAVVVVDVGYPFSKKSKIVFSGQDRVLAF